MSGILHVLYSAITECIVKHSLQQEDETIDISDKDIEFTKVIPKETAEMAVRLTEYFQFQRKVYEEVSFHVTQIIINFYREFSHFWRTQQQR